MDESEATLRARIAELEEYCGEHPEDEDAAMRLDTLHDALDELVEESDEMPDGVEYRKLADGSMIVHVLEQNAVGTTGPAALVVHVCAKHVVGLGPEVAVRWWHGEAQDTGASVAPAADGDVQITAFGRTARAPLEVFQFAIRAVHTEQVGGDFERWMGR